MERRKGKFWVILLTLPWYFREQATDRRDKRRIATERHFLPGRLSYSTPYLIGVSPWMKIERQQAMSAADGAEGLAHLRAVDRRPSG